MLTYETGSIANFSLGGLDLGKVSAGQSTPTEPNEHSACQSLRLPYPSKNGSGVTPLNAPPRPRQQYQATP